MAKRTEVITDHVVRMEAWLSRHPTATWHRPERGGMLTVLGEHKVTWQQASADPRHDGEERSESHRDLGILCDFLEALERAEMGIRPR